MAVAKPASSFASFIGALETRANRLGGVVFAAALVFAAIFILALFNLRAEKIFTLPAGLDDASAEDITAYWRAGRMAIDGAAASAYDAAAFRAGLPPPNHGLLWLNPPHFLLLVTPLSLLPYPALKALWIALSAALLLLCVRMTAPRPLFYAAALLSPAAFVSLLVMQSGPMIAAGLAAALITAERRPLVAGVILALLTMKPQYGLFAPVFLAAIGAWRAFAAAAITTGLLAALSAVIFGAGVWLAFLDYALGGGLAGHSQLVHRDMVTIHQTVGKLGGDATMRSLAQFAVILISGVAVFFAARRWPRDAAIGFALLASAFASPSLWLYDWPLVAAGLFMLARAGSPWPPLLQLAAAALWIAPVISLYFATMHSSLAAPAIFAVTLVGFWFWGDQRRPDEGSFKEPPAAL